MAAYSAIRFELLDGRSNSDTASRNNATSPSSTTPIVATRAFYSRRIIGGQFRLTSFQQNLSTMDCDSTDDFHEQIRQSPPVEQNRERDIE